MRATGSDMLKCARARTIWFISLFMNGSAGNLDSTLVFCFRGICSDKEAAADEEEGGMMEWEAQELQQQSQNRNQNGVVVGGSGGLYVKVMTDEQMELLRRQISVYATICEQLVTMHKSITAQQDAGL